MEEYLSPADAARRLGVTPAAVRLMRRNGVLPIAARTEGGIYLFRPGDVDDLRQRRAQKVGGGSRGRSN